MSKEKMDAKYVTDKAVSLIKLIHNPPIGAKEFSGGWCPERCDAILFDSNSSYMIETKISRSDFLADAKKPHRNSGCGIGHYRYYACPEGLISPDELPPKWGLIYVRPKGKRAIMPVGYGGWVRNPKSDHKHPEYGWTVEGVDWYGSPLHREPDGSYEHSSLQQPRKSFRFDVSEFERSFLFALATRYKSGKFMENIL